MHYHCEVWIKDLNDVDNAVADALWPFAADADIEFDEEGWYNPNELYDWYQIGGRWTGHYDGYDPKGDINNWENCHLCHGTGFRDDAIGQASRVSDPTYTCNKCGKYDYDSHKWVHCENGPGYALKWPTDWVRYDGDIKKVKDLRNDYSCWVLIVKDRAYKKDNPGDMLDTIKAKLDELDITDGYLVTVDCHD